MQVHYTDEGKHAEFNGEVFTRDERTGYYLTTNNAAEPGRRLHRVVWEYFNGSIPTGYDIHHKDHNKKNNDIENLTCVSRKEHRRIHADEVSPETIAKMRKNLTDNARPLASQWHKSEAGREWHRVQYERTKDRLHAKKKFICEYCGREYEGTVHSVNRFCSNKCKSAWRRKAGANNVEKVCVICGAKFMTDKYKKTSTCSRVCAAALRKAHEYIQEDKRMV